jgi:serine/threonine-protein kinase
MSGHRVTVGDVLDGKYRVEKVLGAGGMGVVVAARHVDLGQMVAIKFMLKESLADPAHGERFLREAKAAVQLRSVHTARVLDVGRMRNGEPYMVMEYLEGCDLDVELHARGRLPPHVAVDYILQASEALAEAHALGMIHRDVKLKNLFLTQTVDGRPLVKVLDFGLAKTLGLTNDVSLTATNSVFGSPQYMSPEQMRSAKDVDARSDIWSAGVCLFELLTGRLPFDGSGIAEICAMVLKDPVPRPSMFVTGIPPDLENVVLRCLEKDPTARFQSFAELAFALQHYAPDESSARRIMNVMQGGRREIPSSPHALPNLNSGPISAQFTLTTIDGGAKTLNAWDSDSAGAAGTRRLRLTRAQWLASLTVCASLLVFGVALIVALRARSQSEEQLVVQRRLAEMSATPLAVVPSEPPPQPAAAVPAPDPPTASATATATAPSATEPAADTAEPPPAPPASPAAPPAGAGAKAAKPRAIAPEKHTPPPAPLPIPAAKPAPAPATTGSAKPPPKKGPGSGAEYM